MPYSELSEARIKELDGAKLTLAQVNKIAEMADAIGGDYGWPTAISNFKRSHEIVDGSWIVKTGESKEYVQEILVQKQDNGKYRIVSVSTAALEDKEGETFSVPAIDYEIKQSKFTGRMPYFTMFHEYGLKIGKVTKMRRVGVFAIDEGESFDDPFSLEVCEKMLSNNDGRWRTSRGFYALEVSGGCPKCGESLVLETKHMVAGYSCPVCKAVQVHYKGVLHRLHFRKTWTFEDTITDRPCVPYTGVSAFRDGKSEYYLEDIMDKTQLKKQLLHAGLDEALVDAKLETLKDDQLADLDGIPAAKLLKQLDMEETEDAVDDLDVAAGEEPTFFVLDPEVLNDFGDMTRIIVKEEITKALDGLELEVPEAEAKDLPALKDIQDTLAALADAVEALTQKDDERLAMIVKNMPRQAKFRIQRYKGVAKLDEEELEDEEDEKMVYSKKKVKKSEPTNPADGVVYGSDGRTFESLTAALQGDD